MPKFKIGDEASFADGWTGKRHVCEIMKVNDTTPVSYDVIAYELYGSSRLAGYGATLDEDLLSKI